jgi:hypothetical protein
MSTWETPSFEEVKMDSEVTAYQEDGAGGREDET